MLVDIAEMYEVDVREIIDGERTNDNMTSEVKEVAEKMADYSKMAKTAMLKWIKTLSVAMIRNHRTTVREQAVVTSNTEKSMDNSAFFRRAVN